MTVSGGKGETHFQIWLHEHQKAQLLSSDTGYGQFQGHLQGKERCI